MRVGAKIIKTRCGNKAPKKEEEPKEMKETVVGKFGGHSICNDSAILDLSSIE